MLLNLLIALLDIRIMHVYSVLQEKKIKLGRNLFSKTVATDVS